MTLQESILSAPSPAAQKFEQLRGLFPQTPPAGVRVEADGFELRWVGKREAFHNAFVPAQKIVKPAPEQSKNWNCR